MTRDDELVSKAIELAGSTGNELKLGQALGFELRLRTEGEFLVASRLTVTNFHYHDHPARDGVEPEPNYSVGSASLNRLLKTIICGLVVPR